MPIEKKLANKRILIVDDVASMRNITKSILREFGFLNLDDAQDGEEALNKLKSSNYDLVICDWNMPKMTGIELFIKMQKDDKLKDIFFLLVTASSETTKVKEAMQFGITDYIIKPYKADTLLKKITTKFSLQTIQP